LFNDISPLRRGTPLATVVAGQNAHDAQIPGADL
jgi:hypothetical protein